MAWAQLDVNRPHLVYIILGAFTTIFMLCSSVIKERLYIGEATVATIVGIIFGPHCANLINPLEWGNTDQITLEFCRIVLVVQCFAVGVELPKSYMERHWKSVTLLLVPVMTFGWLVTSLFIWWMFGTKLDWLDSLCVAACVTATDPVLASSVVGKGKFAKRVPKHLRDLLSAESGCNDGMAFPFIFLALYLIKHRPDVSSVSFHWFCYTILYECIFGAVYGVVVGYIARRAIRFAHERDLIDRESFLVFYFVLALFCAGSGSILGVDDLLVGFACGVGFSNDGWFQEKTEESHVSNVIDLLINLAFFVYFGTIIPWDQYNSAILGTSPWRLIVVSVLVIFFRRIPIMVALKPIIPDIKTWREAVFAGHFGPIGVGAIFVAILARAELETDTSTPLAKLPPAGFEHLNIIELIWPITTFLVIVSILVHGSSVAVFTLGRHINTLTLTLSFTQANEDGPTWMDRLPRIQSRSKSSMSGRRPWDSESSNEEKTGPDGLPQVGMPGNFLRRQKEEESGSRSSSLRPFRRRKWDAGIGPGGPVSQSAIMPARRHSNRREGAIDDSGTLAASSGVASPDIGTEKKDSSISPNESRIKIFDEGEHEIVEDEDGNVLKVLDSNRENNQKSRKEASADNVEDVDDSEAREDAPEISPIEHIRKVASEFKTVAEEPSSAWRDFTRRMSNARGMKRQETHEDSRSPEKKRGPALAYQFGNTIIVEDEDGEVVRKFDIPPRPNPATNNSLSQIRTRERLGRMGSYFGMSHVDAESGQPSAKKADAADDENLRFTITAGGRRMSKVEFIEEIRRMDSRARTHLVDQSDAPDDLKQKVKQAADDSAHADELPPAQRQQTNDTFIQRVSTAISRHAESSASGRNASNEDIPFHPVSDDLARMRYGQGTEMTAAQRRRQRIGSASDSNNRHGSDSHQTNRQERSQSPREARPSTLVPTASHTVYDDEPETVAERRRREQALASEPQSDSSSDSEAEGPGTGFRDLNRQKSRRSISPDEPRVPQTAHQPRGRSVVARQPSPPRTEPPQRQSIRFAETPTVPTASGSGTPSSQRAGRGMRLRWGENPTKKK